MKDLTLENYQTCTPDKIHLGDIETAESTFQLLKSLGEHLYCTPSQLILRGGELTGFNLILTFPPVEEITFFSPKSQDLEYLKLLIELIAISSSANDFISRVFSRTVESFLQTGKTLFPFSRLNASQVVASQPLETLKSSLNEITQWAYLNEPYDKATLKDTLSRLSEDGKRRYKDFFSPFLPGNIIFEDYSCRRLLPCWPVNEPVPFLENLLLGQNIYKEKEPNTNTFFFGTLWLANDKTFHLVKDKISKSTVRFVEFDLDTEEISLLLDPDRPAVLYAADTNQKNLFFWRDKIEKWKKAFQGKSGSLQIISRNQEVEFIDKTKVPMVSPTGKPGLPFKNLQETMDFLQQEIDEGHILKKQAEFFKELFLSHPEVKKVLEIGFNAGHSAEVFLSARHDITVLSFDKMDHAYTKYGQAFLDFRFPDRLKLIPGDSKQSVPLFHEEHPTETFDLIFIDGGHDEETAWKDLIHCQKFATKDTLFIMDDIESFEDGSLAYWSRGPTDAWNLAIKEGLVKEFSRERDGPRGWAVGKYKGRNSV